MAGALNWRKDNLSALSGATTSTYDAAPSMVSSFVVPDVGTVSWVPFAISRARELAREGRPIDCVITSSPPHSTQLIGMALHRRGIPWIADLRDGWHPEGSRSSTRPSMFEHAYHVLERRTVRGADLVTAVTAPIAADIAHRTGVNAVVVTNGYDPYEFPARDSCESSKRLADDRTSLVYTGRLAAEERDLEWITEGLEVLLAEDPTVANRLEIVFAGPLTAREVHEIELRSPVLRHVGNLDRREVLELQRAANALLLVVGDGRPSIATGKLYEYLATDLPILVLGEGNEASAIVNEAGAGSSCSTTPTSVAKALASIVSGGLVRSNDRRRVLKYGYDSITRQMAEAVEAAICSAGSHDLSAKPVA
jgi:hypothetical protein